MSQEEIGLYVQQLDELLRDRELQPDEAVEAAGLAGLLVRLGATGGWRIRAEQWRDGRGRHLLREGLEQADGDELLEALDAALAMDEDPDDALFDADELLLATWWAARTSPAREAEAQPLVDALLQRIEGRPEAFAELRAYAEEILASETVPAAALPAQLWRAVAEASRWPDEE